MKKYKLILMAVLFSAGLASCSSDDDGMDIPEPQTATLSVELIDAPGDYEEVSVQVEDVMIQIDSEEEGAVEGWQSLDIEGGIFNLLTLTGGVSEMLVETEVEPGTLTGMRLVLGNNNTVRIDGTSYPLQTSSEQEAGLTFQVNKELEAGMEYNFIMDFNVEESIVKAEETGNYILEPQVRLSAEDETGSISGAVSPIEVQALVTATDGTVTVSSYTSVEGQYELRGLPAGQYEVTILPDVSLGLPSSVYNNVSVEIGQTTELDPITWELD